MSEASIQVKPQDIGIVFTCKKCGTPVKIPVGPWTSAPLRCKVCNPQPGSLPVAATGEEHYSQEHLTKLVESINQIIREQKKLLFDVTIEIPARPTAASAKSDPQATEASSGEPVSS